MASIHWGLLPNKPFQQQTGKMTWYSCRRLASFPVAQPAFRWTAWFRVENRLKWNYPLRNKQEARRKIAFLGFWPNRWAQSKRSLYSTSQPVQDLPKAGIEVCIEEDPSLWSLNISIRTGFVCLSREEQRWELSLLWAAVRGGSRSFSRGRMSRDAGD